MDARPFIVPAAPRPEPARTASTPAVVPQGPPLPADVISVPVPTGLETTIPPIESGPAIDPRRFVVGPAFVVDTTGRVEPESIGILKASHEAFGASAMAALQQSRFRPAVARGPVVRQLVRQAISFRIE